MNTAEFFFLPLGSYEQHGPYLPASVDAEIAVAVAERSAEISLGGVGLVVLPCIPYGASREHMWSEVTIDTQTAALVVFIETLLASVWSHNDSAKVLLINGHGGNRTACELIVERASQDAVRAAHVGALIGQTQLCPLDVHGGIAETSLMMTIRPEAVDESATKALASRPKLSEQALPNRGFSQKWTTNPSLNEFSVNGVVSSPGVPSSTLGQQLLDGVALLIREHIKGWIDERP